jgi:hypothetical protein
VKHVDPFRRKARFCRRRAVTQAGCIWPAWGLRELIAFGYTETGSPEAMGVRFRRNYRLDDLFDRARGRSACRTSRVICFANGCPSLSRSRVLRSRLSKERPCRLSIASMPWLRGYSPTICLALSSAYSAVAERSGGPSVAGYTSVLWSDVSPPSHAHKGLLM